jgi:hypothetical protein
MSVSKELYDKHATENKLLQAFVMRSNSPLRDLPICPRCERIGLRDKGWSEKHIMTCPQCGYSGPTTKTYGDFISELLFME